MIDAFIRSMLGTWGNLALDFYLKNDIWINSLVLLYGLCIFLAHASYQRSASFLFNWFQEKYGKDVMLKRKGNLIRLIEKEEIPWDLTKNTFWFPLIAPPNRFVLHIKNNTTLQKLFNKEIVACILRAARQKQDK